MYILLIIFFVALRMTVCPTLFHVWRYFEYDDGIHNGARCCRTCDRSELRNHHSSYYTPRPGINGMKTMIKYVQDGNARPARQRSHKMRW